MIKKKIGLIIDKNMWEIMHLLKTTTEISITMCIDEILRDNIIEYVKKKNISDDMLALIEKKLKTTE